MSKLIISRMEIEGILCGYTALIDHNRLLEFHFQPVSQKSILDNIYVGQVDNLVKNIQGAFIKINKDNFQNEVKNSDKPVLLDFYADWCGPCRMVSPIVDEIAEERKDIKVGKINVDQERELAEAFGVYSIPTLVIMKDGKIVNQAVGARPKEQILAML